jgi:hypothetical protein
VRALAIALTLLLVAGRAGADQALVHAHGDRTRPIGQAFLTHRAGQCWAILPTHVVEEAAGSPAFVREGGLLGEAGETHDLGDDLGLARVEGAIARSCGAGIATISRAVSRRVRDSSVALVRSVNADATLAQLPVAVVDDDGRATLRVRPVDPDEQIRKGQSGSLVVIDDAPVGMLLSVHARYGVGRVLRLDAMLERVEAFLAGLEPAAEARAPATAGGRVVAWSASPVDAEHRAANLLDAGDAPGWRVHVEAWPVEVEMALAGEKRVALAGVELDAGDVPPEERPAQVEVLVAASRERPRWRSVWSGAPAWEDARATLSWAPTWARAVRLRFHPAESGARVLGLNRVRFRTR